MNSSNARIFGFSAVASLAVLAWVLFGLGPAALLSALILVIIEVTFSFDNAIVNAKILERLSPAWQTAFLTIGIILAIFVVRLVLPIIIVVITAGLDFGSVLTLAINHPSEYANKLALAHPLIASFGGAFLMSLALDFFVNGEHKTLWWKGLEKYTKRARNFFLPSVFAVLVISVLALISATEATRILLAGWIGAVSFLLLKSLDIFLEKKERGTKHLAGWAGLGLFIYLQILDASFSLDGVIGAFAISGEVLIIAAGLGIGALWVRSLTIFMVRRGTLEQYKFLEHGAYYTILILAVSMLVSLFFEVPDFITGLAGIIIIGSAIVSSVRAKKPASSPRGS